MANAKKTYCATVSIMGGGSWARHEDHDTAIANCMKWAWQDWRSMFKLDGKTAQVEVELETWNGDGDEVIERKRLESVERAFPSRAIADQSEADQIEGSLFRLRRKAETLNAHEEYDAVEDELSLIRDKLYFEEDRPSGERVVSDRGLVRMNELLDRANIAHCESFDRLPEP